MDIHAQQLDDLNRKDHDEQLISINHGNLSKMKPIYLKNKHMMHLVNGDILQMDVDVIVNPANELLTGGGGLDGYIHQTCGQQLLQECLKIPTDIHGARCPTGECRITPSFNIKAKFIAHTTGPYLD